MLYTIKMIRFSLLLNKLQEKMIDGILTATNVNYEKLN